MSAQAAAVPVVERAPERTYRILATGDVVPESETRVCPGCDGDGGRRRSCRCGGCEGSGRLYGAPDSKYVGCWPIPVVLLEGGTR